MTERNDNTAPKAVSHPGSANEPEALTDRAGLPLVAEHDACQQEKIDRLLTRIDPLMKDLADK